MKRHIYLVKLLYGFASGSMYETRIVASNIDKAMERAKVVLKKEKGSYNTVTVVYVCRLDDAVYI